MELIGRKTSVRVPPPASVLADGVKLGHSLRKRGGESGQSVADVYGSRPMKRARLMAWLSMRCSRALVPRRLRP